MRHEIERLEALNEDLTDLYNKHMRSWADKYNALEAENERLKELCNDLINAALNDCVGGRRWAEVEERALEALKGGE